MSAATTHVWLRRVSDYHSGGVSADERAAVEAHLATCAECRLALAAYRRLHMLARSPLRLGDGGAGPLLDFQPMLLEETMLTTDRDTRTAQPRPSRRTAVTALGAIAAVLLIALLASALFARFRAPTQPVTPRPTATATLDPQSQAYVTLLNTYYRPMAAADLPAAQCYVQTMNTGNLQDLLACRAPIANELALAQALRAQLATANPPARWQSQHTALRQAVQGLIDVETAQLAAIDAHDINRFLNNPQLGAVLGAFCPIVAQLNAGPPPLSPKLSAPEPANCP